MSGDFMLASVLRRLLDQSCCC